MPCLAFYKNKYNLKEIDFPNAAVKAFRQGLFLPMGDHANSETLTYIHDI